MSKEQAASTATDGQNGSPLKRGTAFRGVEQARNAFAKDCPGSEFFLMNILVRLII